VLNCTTAILELVLTQYFTYLASVLVCFWAGFFLLIQTVLYVKVYRYKAIFDTEKSEAPRLVSSTTRAVRVVLHVLPLVSYQKVKVSCQHYQLYWNGRLK